MFSLSSSQKLMQVNSNIYSPIEVDDSILLSSFNGEILKYSQGQLKLFTKINGQIRSLVFDAAKSTYYVADLLKQSVIAINSNDGSQAELVSQYEGVPLEGPNSIALSNKSGNIFFTDSGPFGENVPVNSKGSVFIIDMQQQSIRPLALRCLQSPSGLAFSHDEKVLFVSQTGQNRILRFYESKQGVYYMSVFHQFNGRFGPTSLTVSTSNLLIASLFEFKSVVDEGCLGILNMEGDFIQKVKLSTIGPEISGLFLSRETDEDLIFLCTENSNRQSCHKLMIKIEKLKEN